MKIKTYVKGIVGDFEAIETDIPHEEHFTNLSEHGQAGITINIEDIPENVKEIRFFCVV